MKKKPNSQNLIKGSIIEYPTCDREHEGKQNGDRWVISLLSRASILSEVARWLGVPEMKWLSGLVVL